MPAPMSMLVRQAAGGAAAPPGGAGRAPRGPPVAAPAARSEPRQRQRRATRRRDGPLPCDDPAGRSVRRWVLIGGLVLAAFFLLGVAGRPGQPGHRPVVVRRAGPDVHPHHPAVVAGRPVHRRLPGLRAAGAGEHLGGAAHRAAGAHPAHRPVRGAGCLARHHLGAGRRGGRAVAGLGGRLERQLADDPALRQRRRLRHRRSELQPRHRLLRLRPALLALPAGLGVATPDGHPAAQPGCLCGGGAALAVPPHRPGARPPLDPGRAAAGRHRGRLPARHPRADATRPRLRVDPGGDLHRHQRPAARVPDPDLRGAGRGRVAAAEHLVPDAVGAGRWRAGRGSCSRSWWAASIPPSCRTSRSTRTS